MSTQPGRDAWRDAGVAEPDLHEREVRALDPDDAADPEGVVNLVEEALAVVGQRVSAASAEEYRPAAPRPDLEGLADEADVADQADEIQPLTRKTPTRPRPLPPQTPPTSRDPRALPGQVGSLSSSRAPGARADDRLPT
ncbi:hypothetical protein [Xylanimonas allomyrinae]|uniref:hypothetical protein n=1 Tax=Xylanimonas allomyrinae TaxID=2509459 RepID=UPI001B87AC1C|nr:hypothetical protein [Xylanimonas allomyrinae]